MYSWQSWHWQSWHGTGSHGNGSLGTSTSNGTGTGLVLQASKPVWEEEESMGESAPHTPSPSPPSPMDTDTAHSQPGQRAAAAASNQQMEEFADFLRDLQSTLLAPSTSTVQNLIDKFNRAS